MTNIAKNLSIWEEEQPSRRRMCMLMVTHACNLNCSYCYETHKQNAYMSVGQAKDIIRKEAQFVKADDRFDDSHLRLSFSDSA